MEARPSVKTEAELVAWLAGGGLAGATSLVCWDAALTDRGARAVADAGAELVAIDLSWNHIGPGGAAALVRLPRLVRLRLYHNDVGAEGARQIAHAGAQLEMLNLCGNQVGDAGVAALAGLASVSDLALGWNAIASAPLACPALERLNIRANRLDGTRAAALLDGRLPALRALGLDENPLGDLAPIVAAPGFARLEGLNLGGAELDDRAADLLTAHGSALRELRVNDNAISPAALTALRRALPACEVIA